MARQEIDVPPATGRFVTTEEAAKWLGVADRTLEQLAKRHGLRPVRGGKKNMWEPLAVGVLAYLMQMGDDGGADDSESAK